MHKWPPQGELFALEDFEFQTPDEIKEFITYLDWRRLVVGFALRFGGEHGLFEDPVCKGMCQDEMLFNTQLKTALGELLEQRRAMH